MRVIGSVVYKMSLLGAALIALAVVSVAPGWAQTLIPLPLEDGSTLSVVDLTEIERLNAARIDAERHRGNHTEDVMIDASFVTPLRPVEARGRPAGSAIRFDGESRVLEFAMFVPQPSQLEALRVSTLSSINVLPERSRYRVYLNNVMLGEARLDNITDFGMVEFPIGTTTVVPGLNRVRIELVQYHRIFCGPEASYALWSDIDLATSGGVLASTDGITNEDRFVMGLAGAAATGAGIEIRGAEGLSEHRDAWISQITQRLSSALGGDPISFRFTDYWSVQGDIRSSARITFMPSSANRVTFRTSGDGAEVMVVEFVPGERARVLPEFESILPQVVRRAPPALISLEQPVPFSEFGFSTTDVRDRYALVEQRFRLPEDYVVLTNDKAEIALDYIYADGLPREAVLLVHINGENVRLLPLRGESGQLIEQFPVRFQARLLQSGINTLGFEVIIPGDPADLPCPTQDVAMLAIGEASTISVPYSPSMYMADMHLAFTGLTPGSVQVNDMSGRSFGANDIVTLRAALSGGANPETASLNPRLHLLSLDDLGSIPTGGYQFSRHAIESALFDQHVLAGQTEEVIMTTAAPGQTTNSTTSSLLNLTQRRESPAAMSFGWDWFRGMYDDALHWLQPQTGARLEQWLAEQDGQAVLIQLDPGVPNHLWMVRAPGSDITAIAAAVVAARTNANGPRGQVSVLDQEGRWQNWTAPDRQPVLLEPISMSNIRYVLGNFVSAMPIRYVGVLFFVALLSALVALRLVIATREHRE